MRWTSAPLATPGLFLLASLAAGCGGSSPTKPDTSPTPTPEIQVASVTVTPALDTAVSIGETARFSAVAKDSKGNVLSSATFSWKSTSQGVAAVTSTGQATAKANGTTHIIAATGGKADTAVLVVRQKTASVVVSPDSAKLSVAGDTVRFSAAPQDANAHPVGGLAVTWGISDSSVAGVDSAGLVTAKTDGRIQVVATASGVEGSAVLRVGSLPAPQVTAVSPTPLVEGGTATLSGQGFDGVASGDSVSVDGVAAVVTSASTTLLHVTVPQYDCLPARDVAVRVATAGGASVAGASLEPDESPVSLGVGQRELVTDPSSFCLQFSESASSEQYLVGVQSISSSVGAVTPVSVTAEAANATGAASVARPAMRSRVFRGGGYVPRPPAWQEGQRRADARLRAWERSHLDPRRSIAALRGGRIVPAIRLSVSGSVKVGDTVSLRVPNFSDPCATFTRVTARVQAVGTQAIVVADTLNPSGGFTSADYQDLADQLDSQIFATDTAYFGSPGDIDANGHIVILFTKAVNEIDAGSAGGVVLGFVFGGDLVSRSSCPSSDEGEIYYGRVPDSTGAYGAKSTRSDELARAPDVMAHELVHLIQDGRRFPKMYPDMGPIMAEAQAVFGEEVVGYDVTGRQPYQNYGFDVAYNTGNVDAVDWFSSQVFDLFAYFGFESPTQRVGGAPEQCGWWQQDPSPCVDRPLWYGVGWSYLRWLADRYGPGYPGGEKGLQRAIIGDPGTGLELTSDVVGTPVDSLMAGWAAALYVDDRIASPDPALTFSSWNLFDFEQHTVATAHLVPTSETFADWTATPQVKASSAAYFTLDGTGRPATAVRIRNAADQELPSYMQVWVVRLK